MHTLFDPARRDRTLERILALRPDSPRAWGRMDVAQAMAHCSIALQASTGDVVLPRGLMARMIGPFFKGLLLGPKPFSRNSPTHPMLVLPKTTGFAEEQARLVACVRKFHDAGPASASRFEHGFIGRITGEEWGVLQHKHLDHHLRQFNAP